MQQASHLLSNWVQENVLHEYDLLSLCITYFADHIQHFRSCIALNRISHLGNQIK